MSSVGKRRRLEMDPDDAIDGKSANLDSRQAQQLRHEYRELLTDTNKRRHELKQPGNPGLHEKLDQVSELWPKVGVGQCRVATMDSAVLRTVAVIGAEQAKILNTSLISFDLQAFSDNLIMFMKNRRAGNLGDDDVEEEFAPSGRRRPRIREPLNWAKLGCHCSKFFRRRAPAVDFMYGPMALEAKERRAPQRRRAKEPGERVVPQQVNNTCTYEEATTKEVDRISRLLGEQIEEAARDQQIPVEDTLFPFFDFVIDPASFGRTVENIFHVSFLVKDGLFSVVTHEDDDPPLPYLRMRERSKGGADEVPRQQWIMSINKKQWEELVGALNLRGLEPLIPPRSS